MSTNRVRTELLQPINQQDVERCKECSQVGPDTILCGWHENLVAVTAAFLAWAARDCEDQ